MLEDQVMEVGRRDRVKGRQLDRRLRTGAAADSAGTAPLVVCMAEFHETGLKR